ncbi:unnamed protein product [Lathyrus oleraceus]
MSVKMRTTCTWTERPYEASLFPGIGFGLFLAQLRVEGKDGPLPGGLEPSVRYHSGRARILTLCQDRPRGQSQVEQFSGGVGLPKGNGGCKGFLGPDGDWPSSAKAEGRLGLQDPPVEQGRKSALVIRRCRGGRAVAQRIKVTLGITG